MKIEKLNLAKLNSVKILSIMILGLMILLPMVVQANTGNPNPGILPPGSNAYGSTYGEWSAKWWQWAYSMPTTSHPLFDADCSKGQSGDVWFLGGTFSSEQLPSGIYVGIANRNCVIPTGKALFFPILNVESSVIENNGINEAELRAYSEWLMNHAVDLQADIDGVAVKDLQIYRKQSPLFIFGPLPDNNVLQFLGFNNAFAGTTSESVADGVYLLLAPLPKGDHKIHYSGEFIFTNENDGFDYQFKLDVNYNLKVVQE